MVARPTEKVLAFSIRSYHDALMKSDIFPLFFNNGEENHQKVKLQVPAGKTLLRQLVQRLDRQECLIQDFVHSLMTKPVKWVIRLFPLSLPCTTIGVSRLLSNSPASIPAQKHWEKVGEAQNLISIRLETISRSQLEEIASVKMKDLNANDMDAAVKLLAEPHDQWELR